LNSGVNASQSHRLGRDHVLERAALETGKDLLVDVLPEPLLAEDQTAAWATQGLVSGGRDDVRVRHGRGVDPRGDEPGDVRHVHDEHRANLVGDALERREIDDARVGATAADQDARPLPARDVAHLVIVDAARVLAHAVVRRAEQRPRKVHRRAVSQVAAMR